MIRLAGRGDMNAVLEIYNEAIMNTTAIYDYKPHMIEDRLAWYDKKIQEGFPVLVFEENHVVIGFATFGPFRAWPAYQYTVEHSVYVHEKHRGKGIGTKLMGELMRILNERGYATIVAGIDGNNEGSKVMHEKLGFTYSGTIRKAGYKFGKWLDLCFYQYELRGPLNPRED